MAAVMTAVVVDQKTIEREDVDAALEAWARWAKRALSGLGWPPVSLIAKMVEYGVLGTAQSSGIRIVEVDGACEVVDKAIRQLPEKERRAVVVFYTGWYPREVCASKCGVTENNFRQLLYRARRSIKSFLAGTFLRYTDFRPSL